MRIRRKHKFSIILKGRENSLLYIFRCPKAKPDDWSNITDIILLTLSVSSCHSVTVLSQYSYIQLSVVTVYWHSGRSKSGLLLLNYPP